MMKKMMTDHEEDEFDHDDRGDARLSRFAHCMRRGPGQQCPRLGSRRLEGVRV